MTNPLADAKHSDQSCPHLADERQRSKEHCPVRPSIDVLLCRSFQPPGLRLASICEDIYDSSVGRATVWTFERPLVGRRLALQLVTRPRRLP
jgi:hypothetical protein